MIDLRAARADPEGFRGALARKGAAEAFDELMQADARWRELETQASELRAETKTSGKPSPEELERLKGLKGTLQQVEAELEQAAERRQELLACVPNPPDPSVPDGDTEEDAVEVRRVGEQPSFSFQPRDHLELAEPHGWIDLERAARVSGSRFAYRIGEVALLELALYRFALDRLVTRGFVPMLPPVLVREEAMYGTGFLPTEEVNIYRIERDDLYLTGTSEVGLASFHMGEELGSLPLRYAGYSTNFRRDGKLEPVHTLNGTAMTARWLIALMETFQDEGGSVAVPDVLTSFGAPPTLG